MILIEKDIKDIRDLESEAGVIATILNYPEYTFYSEQLKPNYFSDNQNGYIYYAVSELAKKGITKIDSYNITNILNMREATKKQTETLTVAVLDELIELSKLISRDSVNGYKLLVDNVIDKAFKRDTFKKLMECERLCFAEDKSQIQEQIYKALDDVMLDFSTTVEIPQYKDVIDDLWKKIKDKQGEDFSGIQFKYKTLNNYVTIEPAELVIFAADTKVGKSMLLLNCTVDLLKKDMSVLYIDSELNSENFTRRLIAHISGVEYNRVKTGKYNLEESKRIEDGVEWLKTRNLTHIYIPMFDSQTIYTTVKKVKHTQGIDVLVVDYFKSKSDGDAFNSYQELGKLVDLVKNTVCGDMNIAGIGAVQATSTGKIADSAKIGRNASTIVLIERKTQEEIQRDGIECGNTKMRVVLNRNGMQHSSDEYIDLAFNGNLISYEEAKQHTVLEPY